MQKVRESELPAKDQHEHHLARQKYAPQTLLHTDARLLKSQLQDPVVFSIFQKLERNSPAECFIELYKSAVSGKLCNHETFMELCRVFTDQFRRMNSDNPNAKYGIRYPETYINFMLLMRAHGGNSA